LTETANRIKIIIKSVTRFTHSYIEVRNLDEKEFVLSPWVTWDIDKWKKFYDGIPLKKYSKKSSIFNQGDTSENLYIVASGRVRIAFYTADGGEKHLYIAEKGCLFCENALFSDKKFFYSAVAIVDSEIYDIPKSRVLDVMKNNWDTTLELLQFTARKNLMFLGQITDLSFTQSVERIGKTLVNLCNQYGTAEEDGIRINIRFTHQDVAAIVATTRVTVSNVFNYFIDEGILARSGSYFVVKDIARLKGILSAQEKLSL